MLIASTDNLTGLSEALNAVFPKTGVQLYAIHPICNTLKYVTNRDQRSLPLYITRSL